MKRKKCDIGKLLMEYLTRDQIAALLDVLFSTGDMDQYADRFKKVDPDMAETVSEVLEMDYDKGSKPSFGRIASDQRIIEHWNSLWSHWNTAVLDVGDEEGSYAVQDAHWEPPYFDGSLLADDLDQVAGDMLSLIDDVYDLVENPDLFSDALDEINSNISSYPEWMSVEYGDGCILEKNATLCVLKWLWLSSHKVARPGKAFLDKVYEIEDHCNMAGLDENWCVDFFAELPDVVCREIYECFINDDRRDSLGNIHSMWHTIHHLYEERFDSGAYLETCRKHLARNWRYGQPLIDDAVDKEDYQKAELLLEKTFSSFLGREDRTTWYPETSLLLDERRYYYENNKEEISGLLKSWTNVSEKLGNTKRNAASKFQSVAFGVPEDWDAVIGEYGKHQNPEAKSTIDSLFSHWQTEMARRSLRYVINDTVSSDTWVHWLIEAELDSTGKREWFMEKLNAWLAHLKKDRSVFEREWRWLARLTRDLPESSKLKKQYPTFFKIVLPEDSEASLLSKVRRRGLEKIDAGSCLSNAMDVWKDCLHYIIPDPAHSYRSNYTNHAQWMKALYELNRNAYDVMLAQWQEKHKLRRNLWRDMKNYSLPV
ncbi:MAG: hypothetical protein KAW14_13370 [Candidatus Aegiribacteria sp.]|nr:hypothetical protein [Candidatus Aegiribacteria sp.]